MATRDWELYFAYMDGEPPAEDFNVINLDVPVELLPLLGQAAEIVGVHTAEFVELAVWEALVDAHK